MRLRVQSSFIVVVRSPERFLVSSTIRRVVGGCSPLSPFRRALVLVVTIRALRFAAVAVIECKHLDAIAFELIVMLLSIVVYMLHMIIIPPLLMRGVSVLARCCVCVATGIESIDSQYLAIAVAVRFSDTQR